MSKQIVLHTKAILSKVIHSSPRMNSKIISKIEKNPFFQPSSHIISNPLSIGPILPCLHIHSASRVYLLPSNQMVITWPRMNV
jgi:hypothetical protein